MQANNDQLLILAVFSIFTIVVILLIYKIMINKKNANNEMINDRLSRQKKRLLDRQENLGNRVSNTLKKAVEENGSGLLRVKEVNGKDIGYFINVVCQPPNEKGYPVLQVHFRLFSKRPVEIFIGPQPKPDDGTMQFPKLKDMENGKELVILHQRILSFSLTESLTCDQ